MRHLWLVVLAACGPHLKTEVIGTRPAAIAPRGTPPPTTSAAIALPAGTYDLAIWFDVPRSQHLDWTLACGGVEQHGQLGETFDEYRVHRLAELAAAREHERRQVAGVTSLLVAAVAPHASTATATVAVDPDAAGDVVANAAVDPRIAPPPDDVGATRYGSDVRIDTTITAPCALSAATDDATVTGSFRITRIRDLDAEARAVRAAATARALDARASFAATLVAAGADREARQRRIDAAIAIREARLDAEAAVRARFEAEAAARVAAHAEIVARVHARAFEVRGYYETWLVGTCHADPQARARRIAARDTADAALHARTDAAIAVHRHQAELALALREQLRGQLIARGARLPERVDVAAEPMPTGVDREGGREIGVPTLIVPIVIDVHPRSIVLPVHRPPPPPKSGPTVRDHRKP